MVKILSLLLINHNFSLQYYYNILINYNSGSVENYCLVMLNKVGVCDYLK